MRLATLIALFSVHFVTAQPQAQLDRLKPKIEEAIANKDAIREKEGRLSEAYYKSLNKIISLYREANPYGQNDFGVEETYQTFEEIENIRYDMALKYGRISQEYHDLIQWLGPMYTYHSMILQKKNDKIGTNHFIALQSEARSINRYLQVKNEEWSGKQRMKMMTISLIDPGINTFDPMYLETDLVNNGSETGNARNSINQRLNSPDENNAVLLYQRIVKLTYFDATDKETANSLFNKLLDELLIYCNEKVAKFDEEAAKLPKDIAPSTNSDSLKFINDFMANYAEMLKGMEERGQSTEAMKQQIAIQAATVYSINRHSQRAVVQQQVQYNIELYTPQFFKDYITSLKSIKSSRANLNKRTEQFITATIRMYDQKTRKNQRYLEYSRNMKYQPNKLLQYLNNELNDPENKIKDSDRNQLKIVQSYYSSLKGIKQAQEITELQDENALMEEWGRYQNLFLNIAVTSYEDHQIDLFNSKSSFVGIDDLLTMKGADFRAKKFILTGLQNAQNEALWKRYKAHLKDREELNTIQLITDTERKANGWTSERIDNKIKELKKFQSTLYLFTKNFVNSKEVNNLEVTWKKIQQRLMYEEAVVSINRVERITTGKVQYLVTIITKRDKQLLIIDEGAILESKHYDAYKNSINFKIDDSRSYAHFWEKIADKLPNIKVVYFSPDGVYHKISIPSLMNPQTKEYIQDKTKIIQLNEVSDFFTIKSNRIAKKTQKTGALFGRPAYYKSPDHDELTKATTQRYITRSFASSGSISDLPQTEVEVQSIAKTLDSAGVSSEVYMGVNASEKNLKSVSNTNLLHIATHGFFEEDLPSNPKGDGFFSYDQKTFLQNPLLRSGLVMSGAGLSLEGKNKNVEDGIVTAQEISFLPLQGTELVVLSACETGLGEISNGEGVQGLQRAFLLAGSNAVLISLWEVDDKATQQLMQSFYKYWITQNKKPRDALELAKTDLRKQYKHPNYWAAFLYLGK